MQRIDNIVETIRMIERLNLDIRTITMGISINDCADNNPDVAAKNIYDKICSYAKNLVKTGEDIEKLVAEAAAVLDARAVDPRTRRDDLSGDTSKKTEEPVDEDSENKLESEEIEA